MKQSNQNSNAFLRRIVDQHVESLNFNDIKDIIDSHLLVGVKMYITNMSTKTKYQNKNHKLK